MRQLFSAVLLGVSSGLAPIQSATPFNFIPSADTSLVEDQPLSNFGGDSRLWIGTESQGKNAVALLKFDLSPLPMTGSVVYATLTLKPGLAGGSYDLFRVLRPWGEGAGAGAPAATGEANWQEAMRAQSAWAGPGGTAGADFTAEERSPGYQETAADELLFAANANLIADLEEWRDNAQSNHGLMLRRDLCCGQSTARAAFFSSEAAANSAPELKVYLGDPTSPLVLLHGEVVPEEGLDFGKAISVEIQAPFPGGSMFYTLDGSEPTVQSPRAASGLVVSNSVVLRLLAYSSDFSQVGRRGPLEFRQRPAFEVITRTSGGGVTYVLGEAAPKSIFFNGRSEYFSNSVVRVLAVPGAEAKFLHWMGDVAETNAADTTVLVDGPKDLIAVFGYDVKTTVQGQGGLQFNPPSGPYPVSSTVTVTPIPAEGHYFAQWGNAATGSAIPASLTILGSPTLSALFLPLGPNQATLTTRTEGGGIVQSANPKNVYNAGESVELTATPLPGFTFVGWSGAASGSANPLNLTLSAGSHQITARFSGYLHLQVEENPDSLTLNFAPIAGFDFRIQSSTNLTDWMDGELIANPDGPVTRTFSTSNGGKLFYRVQVLPRE